MHMDPPESPLLRPGDSTRLAIIKSRVDTETGTAFQRDQDLRWLLLLVGHLLKEYPRA
jgi:hypothetical protein